MAVIVAIVLFGFGAGYFANSPDTSTGKVESITIGLASSAPAYTPIYIAQSQGFFAGNGLNVTIREYDSGQDAIKGMLNGEVDIAGGTEGGIIGSALNKRKFKVFSTIDKNQGFYLTGRKDRGIEDILDLNGKRVGVTLGGIGEFYLGRFLELHRLKIHDISLVNVKPPSTMDAITGGDVDAVVVHQPYSHNIRERLGANGITWQVQSSQPIYTIVITRSDWISGHPKLVIQFLNALAQAEGFILNHPAEAKATVQKLLNYDDAFVAENWHEHQFSLSLDQSLVLAMEDEARWMINNNLTSEKQVPDFLDYIYLDGLEKIKPESVNIIR